MLSNHSHNTGVSLLSLIRAEMFFRPGILYLKYWPSRGHKWKGIQKDSCWNYAAIVVPVDTYPVLKSFVTNSVTAAACQTGMVCTVKSIPLWSLWGGVLFNEKGHRQTSLRGESDTHIGSKTEWPRDYIRKIKSHIVERFCSDAFNRGCSLKNRPPSKSGHFNIIASCYHGEKCITTNF